MTVIDDQSTVTASELGVLLGLTDRRIRQLASDGLVAKADRGQYKLGESIRNIIAATEGKAEPDDLRRARLELMQAQTRRIGQDIALREAQAGDLDWQDGLVQAFSTFFVLRLRNAGSWFVAEFGNRHVTARGIKGDATRALAGWCQETMLGLVFEAQTELGAIATEARRKQIVLDWPSLVRHAEREDLPDDDNG
jgi:hypothetical protein